MMAVVFLAQVLSAATPLVLASLGGVLSERAGVTMLALEAYLLLGAFAAVTVGLATGSVLAAVLAAALAGALAGALFAAFAVWQRASAVVVGVALNLLAVAGTRAALKVLYGSASNSPTLPTGAGLRGSSIAWTALRDALTTPTVWIAPLLVGLAALLLSRTVLGLRITACGEHPTAARAQGVPVARVQTTALMLGGAVAALGGAQLGLHQHAFIASMSGGRGFLAVAAVILGRWRPVRAALWATGIGALSALEATLASSGRVPTVVLQALPFALTLLAVAGRSGKARAPAALG
ncbi:MAG: ABC transporter permease [Deltaproteobacteria bacterium]|nr:ABC transporter permease [Myxococcales bacterium]MDP3218993.1 ABC transporter permease [Deltaproteobacteria bacterium]